MPRKIRLRRLLQRHDPAVEALEQFCHSFQTWVRILDDADRELVECGSPNGESEVPVAQVPVAQVTVDGLFIGTVQGPMADLIGPWLSALATQAHLNRAVGAEVLHLYRQQRVTVSLAEMLSETSEPAVVADMVADAIARALPDTAVAFIDDVGRILASGGVTNNFDRQLKPTEVTVTNEPGRCTLAGPVIGVDRRFGHLQAVRAEPDFTAAEAELLATLGVIAASAIARARAHQAEMERAGTRSKELEATVERLQGELDLVTTTVLASVLFSDLVDSTKSQASVGDEGWARLIETHNRHATDLVEEFGGTLVDFAGDGFFAWFQTPSQAVECGRRHLEMVEQLGLEARAGIHVGEAQQRGAGLSGLTVNTAARIMGNAGGGQVYLSGVTVSLLAGTGYSFEWIGEFELKGLAGMRPIHSLVRE